MSLLDPCEPTIDHWINPSILPAFPSSINPAITLSSVIHPKCQLPCSDRVLSYMEFMSRRSFLSAFNFWMASPSGTSSPFDCVSWSSRLRMFTERDSFSWAPTTSSCQLDFCYQRFRQPTKDEIVLCQLPSNNLLFHCIPADVDVRVHLLSSE